jgi:hypothetical protein
MRRKAQQARSSPILFITVGADRSHPPCATACSTPRPSLLGSARLRRSACPCGFRVMLRWAFFPLPCQMRQHRRSIWGTIAAFAVTRSRPSVDRWAPLGSKAEPRRGCGPAATTSRWTCANRCFASISVNPRLARLSSIIRSPTRHHVAASSLTINPGFNQPQHPFYLRIPSP